MPPKPPKGLADAAIRAAKEAGKAASQSQELTPYGDEQTQKPTRRYRLTSDPTDELSSMMSQNRQLLKDSESSLARGRRQAEDLLEPTTFQDLVMSSRGQKQTQTFSQISEAMQTSIAGKLNFDSSVNAEKKDEIITGFYDVLSNPETPSVVTDSFMAAATRGLMTEIEITGASSKDTDNELVDVKSHYDSYGGLFDEKVQAFDANSQKTSDIMSNLAHEFTHVLQANMESRRETRDAFTDGKLMEAFEKDLKVIDGLIPKRNFEYEIKLESEEDVQAKEVHARVVEAVFQDPEQARKTFPNTLERVEEIHSQYNQAIAKDAMKSLGIGGRT